MTTVTNNIKVSVELDEESLDRLVEQVTDRIKAELAPKPDANVYIAPIGATPSEAEWQEVGHLATSGGRHGLPERTFRAGDRVKMVRSDAIGRLHSGFGPARHMGETGTVTEAYRRNGDNFIRVRFGDEKGLLPAHFAGRYDLAVEPKPMPEPEPKFKVGDLVRMTKGGASDGSYVAWTGKTLRVTRVEGGSFAPTDGTRLVDITNDATGGSTAMFEHRLELAIEGPAYTCGNIVRVTAQEPTFSIGSETVKSPLKHGDVGRVTVSSAPSDTDVSLVGLDGKHGGWVAADQVELISGKPFEKGDKLKIVKPPRHAFGEASGGVLAKGQVVTIVEAELSLGDLDVEASHGRAGYISPACLGPVNA